MGGMVVNLTEVLALIAGTGAAFAAVTYLGGKLRRAFRLVEVAVRIIDRELTGNSGSSIKDKVDKLTEQHAIATEVLRGHGAQLVNLTEHQALAAEKAAEVTDKIDALHAIVQSNGESLDAIESKVTTLDESGTTASREHWNRMAEVVTRLEDVARRNHPADYPPLPDRED